MTRRAPEIITDASSSRPSLLTLSCRLGVIQNPFEVRCVARALHEDPLLLGTESPFTRLPAQHILIPSWSRPTRPLPVLASVLTHPHPVLTRPHRVRQHGAGRGDDELAVQHRAAESQATGPSSPKTTLDVMGSLKSCRKGKFQEVRSTTELLAAESHAAGYE
jgi:hypothetical protein